MLDLICKVRVLVWVIFFILFFLATPAICGIFQVREGTHTTAATGATAVTTLILNPLCHKGTL